MGGTIDPVRFLEIFFPYNLNLVMIITFFNFKNILFIQ